MIHSWKFEWLTTWQDIWQPDSVTRWEAVLDRADEPHVFATPSLVRAWWFASQHVYEMAPRFLFATHDGITVFIPLVLIKHGLKNAYLRTLTSVGYVEYDYHDPIACDLPADQWPSFWASFRIEVNKRWGSEFDLVRLGGLRSCPSIKGTKMTDRAPYFRIAGLSCAENFLAALGGSLRGDIRRQMRRLEQLGPVGFRVLQPNETNAALIWLPEILEQHSNKWPNSYKLPGFHEAIVREALPRGHLHISEVRVADVVVSRHIGFFYRGRFYWYMPVYDFAYQNYSPGKIHLYFCALDAISRGGEVIDLLRGEEDYKSQWTALSSELVELSWRGSLAGAGLRLAMAESVKPALKKLRTLLP